MKTLAELTIQNIYALEAGRETDILVATAIGEPLDWSHDKLRKLIAEHPDVNNGQGIYVRCEGCDTHGYGNQIVWPDPCPTPQCDTISTCWNSATWAASLANIWNDDCIVSFDTLGAVWKVRRLTWTPCGGEYDIDVDEVAEADTGPLAICKAILMGYIADRDQGKDSHTPVDDNRVLTSE